MFSARSVGAASSANNVVADNKRLDAAATEKTAKRTAGIRLFKTIHPELTEEQAAALADQDPLVVDRMFATLAKGDADKEKVAKKNAQDTVDNEARGVAIRLSREKRPPTDAELESLAASTNGTAVYARFFEGAANRGVRTFEGAANRGSRESEGALNRSAREAAAAKRRLDSLKVALKGATKDEIETHLKIAKDDLREWEEDHENDFPSAEDKAKDPTRTTLVAAVQEAQNKSDSRAKSARGDAEDDLRRAARELDAEDAGPQPVGREADVKAVYDAMPASFSSKDEADAWYARVEGVLTDAEAAALEKAIKARIAKGAVK